eukprot:m.213293 g.213293  ORF g.213293 m.213293 type:complete len:73 (+) comp24978_c0_seq1:49-267(+)
MWVQTALLVSARRNRAVPGKQWIGKHRKVWKYTESRRSSTVEMLERVARNIGILSKPFVTTAQEQGSRQRAA